MAIQDNYERIAKKIEMAVIDIVHNSGHNKTGHLLSSIQVTSDNKGFYFSCSDYVKYLDNGKLLMEIKNKIKDITREEIAEAIKNELTTDI